MSTTIDEARRYLLNLLPPDHEFLYDETTTGDVYLLFDAAGEVFKRFAFDVLDTLQRELYPSSAVNKLVDWITATGLGSEIVAQFGSVTDKQAAVVGKLRESGAFCDPVVASIFSALFGYFPTTPVEIMKSDRALLRQMHTYGVPVDSVVPAGQTVKFFLQSPRGGKLAKCGAVLELAFTSSATGYTVVLTAPDGSSKTWTVTDPDIPFRLYTTDLVGASVLGTWELDISNTGGIDNTLLSAPMLFVEGIGTDYDLAGAVFHWGVFADIAHLGENGATPDLAAAAASIERIKHSHTRGWLITSKNPIPGVSSGPNAAIPGRCIPV